MIWQDRPARAHKYTPHTTDNADNHLAAMIISASQTCQLSNSGVDPSNYRRKLQDPIKVKCDTGPDFKSSPVRNLFA